MTLCVLHSVVDIVYFSRPFLDHDRAPGHIRLARRVRQGGSRQAQFHVVDVRALLASIPHALTCTPH